VSYRAYKWGHQEEAPYQKIITVNIIASTYSHNFKLIFLIPSMLHESVHTAMTRTIYLAKYLFTRLNQQGVRKVYGVPGDYTLKAIDHLKQSGLQWISNCNELNAGYAADGSARITGLSALFTTHGVGELSAINAVAGSYAEHVPVMHVVGSPSMRLQESGAVLHHTLGNGRNGVFREMRGKVTVVCSALWDARTALQVIDDSIVKCLRVVLIVVCDHAGS
jgi:pyruvate decarboxylase